MNFKQKRLLDLAYRCVYSGKEEYVKTVLVHLLKNNTANPEILRSVSKLYGAMRNFEKALAYANKAFELEKSVENLELLAAVNYDNRNFQDAAIFYEELTKYKEDDDVIYHKCLASYSELGLETEGIRVLEEGAKKNPSNDILATLVFQNLILGIEDKCEYWKDELVKRYPNSGITENALGFVSEAIDNDYSEAKKHYLKSAKMGYVNAYYNLGVCCKQSEDFVNAEKYLKKLKHVKKDVIIDYYYTLGSIYLAQRKFKLGHKYYWNRKNKQNINPYEKNHYWDGKDYPNKILYVSQEQGYGDNIQFSRFIPEVARKFKKVYYGVDKSLFNLMKRSLAKYSNVEVIPYGKLRHYNRFVMIMDIQNLLNISYHNIPHQKPYIITDKLKDEEYKMRYFDNDNLKIGLNWRAKGMGLRDAVYRTIDAPYYFRKLFDIEENKYYSLQMNDIFGMLEKYPQIQDLTGNIQSFDDTASMLKNLDILITVDTAIAHLAGAMGVKTYLLLCHAPDWRWFDNETKTEWYDNVIIIKQKDRRSWDDVSEKLYEYILADTKKHNKNKVSS